MNKLKAITSFLVLVASMGLAQSPINITIGSAAFDSYRKGIEDGYEVIDRIAQLARAGRKDAGGITDTKYRSMGYLGVIDDSNIIIEKITVKCTFLAIEGFGEDSDTFHIRAVRKTAGWHEVNKNNPDTWAAIKTWSDLATISLDSWHNGGSGYYESFSFYKGHAVYKLFEEAIRNGEEIIYGFTLDPDSVNGRYADVAKVKTEIEYHYFQVANLHDIKGNLGGTLNLISRGEQPSITNLPSGNNAPVYMDSTYASKTNNEKFVSGDVVDKHIRWDYVETDYKLTSKDFPIDQTKLKREAIFKTQSDATFQVSQGSGMISLRDPWYVDPGTGAQPNTYHSVEPGIPYKVFRDQQPNPSVPEEPYYSLHASMVATANAIYDLASWDTTGAELLEHPNHPGNNRYKAVVFNADGASVTANYTQINNTAGTYTLEEGETLTIPASADITLATGFVLEIKGKLLAEGQAGKSVLRAESSQDSCIRVLPKGIMDVEDLVVKDMTIILNRDIQITRTYENEIEFTSCSFMNTIIDQREEQCAPILPPVDLFTLINCTLYGSTIYSKLDTSLLEYGIQWTTPWNTTMVNNIFKSSTLQFTEGTRATVDEDYNLFYGTSYNLKYTQGLGPHSIDNVNPLLKVIGDDVTLTYSSPCKDAGDPVLAGLAGRLNSLYYEGEK